MSNPPKKKGTAAEVAVVQFLQEHGWPLAERRALAGTRDRGDVAGIPGVVIEVKNHQGMDLAGWLDEARREAAPLQLVAVLGADGRDSGRTVYRQADDLGVVWHKRRGRGSPGDWYVSMDGWTFLELLKEWAR